MEIFTWTVGFLFIIVESIRGFEFQNELGIVGCYGRPMDVAFAFDTSKEISIRELQKQVEITKDVLDDMDVGMGDNQVRIAAMSFGDRTRIHLHFGQSKERENVKSRLERVQPIGGNPNLANALKRMCMSLFRRRRSSRSGVKHLGIVFTNGNSQNEKESRLAAEECRRSGVELFAIGFSKNIFESQLKEIVNRPLDTHLLHVHSLNDLHQIRNYITQRTCQAAFAALEAKDAKHVKSPQRNSINPVQETHLDERACRNKVADVFFLLDSSSSIHKEDFKKQINVVESIIRRFDIGPSQTRVGISTFSHKYQNLLTFGDANDKDRVLHRLSTISYLSGGTRTGHALHRLRTKVFNDRVSRREVDRIIVVFTDGRSGDYRRTTLESRLLKKMGIKMFVVGIGSHVDRAELGDIASRPLEEFLHTFDSFDSMLAKSGLLGSKTCEGINNLFINDQDVCNSSQPTDVMFMVSHNHLGQRKTNSIMKVVAEIVEIFGTNGPFRVGTMFDECLMNQDIPIGSITNKTKLLNRIDDSRFGTPKSMIQQLRFDVFSHHRRTDRRRVRRLGLVFLDQDMNLDDPNLRIESQKALRRGIQLYPIAVGKGIDLEQVEKSIAPRDRIISVPNYETLASSLPSLLVSRLCLRRNNAINYNGFSK